ncbi:hypothetical protein E2C01_088270 [Portunus trituberculatus]|uniref:Uncharacterized protein n=1 Tax=Portunus trituberculatus TaxID=210409 RepID=A0A5B7JJE2_PORTR|nr:hypothetical protein [Portunus trituberculatus]
MESPIASHQSPLLLASVCPGPGIDSALHHAGQKCECALLLFFLAVTAPYKAARVTCAWVQLRAGDGAAA